MLISELIIDDNKKLLDLLSGVDTELYNIYEDLQIRSDDFSIPATDLFTTDDIYKFIYYFVDSIEQLDANGVPNNSQIKIGLNELLDYFNG